MSATVPPQAAWQPLSGPWRRYPARADDQASPRHADTICSRCLGGTCCTTEGPIALTPFDVLRLCAALDLAPADFMRLFTQDRFEGPDGARYRDWLADPASSVVSFVRRRTLEAASPCIFLKYAADADGTPRRVCSVHPARPLACREYYDDTCTKRWTGEMAVLQAIGYEALRDGRIDRDEAERRLAASGPVGDDEPLAASWQRAFWGEMRRAVQPEAANFEGAADSRLADFQDPIAVKIDRLLSTANLRFEEKYGAQPVGEQLHRFDAGLSLRTQGERERLLGIATRPAGEARLYDERELTHHLGMRSLLGAPATPVDELLQFSRQVLRKPDFTEIESPCALHAALCIAQLRHSQAGKSALRKSMARHAAIAIAYAEASLAAADGDAAPDAANSLALLALAGFAEAGTALRRVLAGVAERRCRIAAVQARQALRSLDGAAEASRWLPLVAWDAGERNTRRLLAALWSDPALQSLEPEAQLQLADHSLRQPGFDVACLARVQPALDGLLGAQPRSIWDARPGELGERWQDAYVIRAIDRAGLRAAIQTLHVDAAAASQAAS